jgi:hypothetical protein
MAIIALKAWYLEQYEPIREVIKRPVDLRLNRNSLLKSGLRADFLNEGMEVQQSAWFERYLDGETVEFYIEGSGGYAVSNVDLISQEIYFTKHDVLGRLEPIIFFAYQQEYPQASEMLRESLERVIEQLNTRNRTRPSLSLVMASRGNNEPLRLSRNQLRNIRKSLLFIADGTPVAQASQGKNRQQLPSPNVCVELGYALETKQAGQVLLTRMERSEYNGGFPFDLPNYQQLLFKTAAELEETLPQVLDAMLRQYHF